jgi:uncharacterized protein (UPF0332 family)
MGSTLEYWLSRGELRKVAPNPDRAIKMKADAERRLKFYSGRETEWPSLVVEGYYEACRELLDSLLLIKGYKTQSHVATITTCKLLDIITRDQENLMNISRDHRNRFKYRAEKIEPELARNLVKKLHELFIQLEKI